MYPTEFGSDDRLHSGIDKSLFFIVFLLGSTLIIVEKNFGAPRWVAPATGALAIAFFCLVSWRTPRFRLREDRIGDGAYYLGFLFTLVSLSFALYQFTAVGGVEAVISGFGVALVTTIVGLSLRVVFQQLREDPIEIEQEVRRTLSDEVVKLERELRLSVEAMVALRNRVDDELAKSIGDGLKSILRDSREAMSADTEVFRDAIKTTLSTVEQAVTASVLVAAETRKSTGRLLKAVETLAEKIEQTKSPTSGFRDKVDEFTATLDRMLTREAERIEKTRESSDAILGVYREMETRAVEAAATMEQCKAAVDGMQQSMASSTAGAKEMADSARIVTDELLERSRRHLELLQRVEQTSIKSEEFFRALTETLENQVQMSVGALALLESNVVKAAELVVKELHAK